MRVTAILRMLSLCLAALLAAPATGSAQSPQPAPNGIVARLGKPELHGTGFFQLENDRVRLESGGEARVGGLSGIDLDPAAQDGDPVFFVISDRDGAFYRVRLGIREEGLVGQPEFLAEYRVQGQPADAEGIRLDPRKRQLYWSSEEEPPALRSMSVTGAIGDAAKLPAGYEKTTRFNRGFEGLAISDDGARLFAALEGPLTDDGPEPTTYNGGKTRIIEFAADGLTATRQYVYCVDAVSKPRRSDRKPDRGVAEILWVADDILLVFERGYSPGYAPGKANTAVIYAVDLKRIPQAAGTASADEMRTLVANADCPTYPKALFVDLESFGIWIDNVEGMTFGRPFKNGDRSLVLVTDNNFAPPRVQITQFIVLRLKQAR